MQLVELEIRFYRSIKSQWADESVKFDDLNCLIGKNNAGKSNILHAIKFLLNNEDKEKNEELFWDKDTNKRVEVRGFFDVSKDSLRTRIEHGTLEDLDDYIIGDVEEDRQLGVSRSAEYNSETEEISTDVSLLTLAPQDQPYCYFERAHGHLWERKNERENFTKTDYRDGLMHVFPELTDYIEKDDRKNKNDWKDAYNQYIKSRPPSLTFELEPTPISSSLQKTLYSKVLPQEIWIPALKEMESAKKRSGEFGNLMDEISTVVQDELDQQLQSKLGGFLPEQDDRVKTVESKINTHFEDTFENKSVEFDFPTLSAEYLFDEMDLLINEKNLESLSTQNVGEGVKRSVIFSLIRTLADIREGRIDIQKDGNEEASTRPLLILYEEAELYLHPSLQRTLLRSLSSLSNQNSQIIFSTHSPILLNYKIVDTTHIVQNGGRKTTTTNYNAVLENQTERNKRLFTELQLISDYLFTDTILLVEGESDKIVFDKLARFLNPDWDISSSSISILEVEGAANVERFYKFFNRLGIEVYAIMDIDAVTSHCRELVNEDQVKEKIGEFGRVVEEYTDEDNSDMPTRVRNMPTPDFQEELEDLRQRLDEGENISEDDPHLVERVLTSHRESLSPQERHMIEEAADLRLEVVDLLIDRGILVLSGDLEDYYPGSGNDKVSEAIKFSPDSYDIEEIRDRFQYLDSRGKTDVEAFFEMVF